MCSAKLKLRTDADWHVMNGVHPRASPSGGRGAAPYKHERGHRASRQGKIDEQV
jgi:hypothetical protein